MKKNQKDLCKYTEKTWKISEGFHWKQQQKVIHAFLQGVGKTYTPTVEAM